MEDGNSVTPRTSLLPEAAAEADTFHLTDAVLASNVLQGVYWRGGEHADS